MASASLHLMLANMVTDSTQLKFGSLLLFTMPQKLTIVEALLSIDLRCIHRPTPSLTSHRS